MEEKINLRELWALQRIDVDIKDFEVRKEKLPAELLPLRQNWERIKQELAEMKKNFEAMRVERKTKEGEVAANEEEIKKRNIQLYTLKTNKDYTAMLKEIEELKNKNEESEDKILELMEQSEKYTAVMKEKEREIIVQEGTFKEEEERVKKEIAEIDSYLLQRKKERENQKSKIKDSLYQQYEKIRQGKKGLGIVSIADECCGGCHINLPPQVISEVKMRKVVFCGSCARLLYWDGDSE